MTNILERYLLVALGGAIGSCARFALGTWAATRIGMTFPWGTFAINVVGSLVLGLYVGHEMERGSVSARGHLFVAVGLCGGFTTFSTFSYEAFQLIQRRDVASALAYVLGSAAAGVLAVLLGASLNRGGT